MDRLTREEIVEAFRLGKVHCSTQTFNALCDMALHSLESVRSEALEEAARVCDEAAAQIEEQETEYHGWDKHGHGDFTRSLAAAIRALSPARVAEVSHLKAASE